MPTLVEWAAAVERGVSLLDASRPSWREEIDTDYLDMIHVNACILGQLYGHFTEGMTVLSLEMDGRAATYGFDANSNDEADYALLTHLWKATINYGGAL